MKQKILVLTNIAGPMLLAAVLIMILIKPAGADFNANNLIDDGAFDNSAAMGSVKAINDFLNNNFPNSCISTNHGFAAPDPTGYSSSTSFTYGGDVSAGQVIYDASQAYNLNPQVILTTLEKEESLVSGSAGCSTLRYSAAMGNDCPDGGSSYSYSGFELYSINGAPVTGVNGTCVNSAEAVGFSRQVITATWKLKFWRERAEGNTSWAVIKGNWNNSDDLSTCYYGPMTGGYYKRCPSDSQPTYFDGYDSIDGSQVHLDNGATAALYYYTPHFHGNQLFDSIFQSWFGPTTGEGYVLATSYDSNGDPRQWVVYHGIKRLVPDTATLQAWGLDKVPLLQWDGAYLGSYATADPPLGRLMRPSGTLDVYFVDNGNCYKVVSPAMMSAWGFNPAAVVDVSTYLGQVPANEGALSYAVQDVSDASGAVYMVDGGVNRQYQGPDILHAWEGDNPTITGLSHAYFSLMGTSSAISGTKVTTGVSGATEYQVDSGQKLPESSAVAQLYPGVAQTVSSATMGRLSTSAPASQFIRAAGSSTVYMVDSSTKHAVGSPSLVRAWGVGASPLVDIVTSGNVNLLTTGSSLNSYEADVSGQLYIMDGRKITVPASLDAAYRTTGNVYSPSAALMSLIPSGETAANFIKGFNSPAVYLMAANNLRNIRTPNELTLWTNGGNITSVSDYILQNQFTTGTGIGAYITDGTNNYLIEGGSKHPIDSTQQTNWGVSGPDTLDTATLSRFTTGSSISNQLQNQGRYYFVQEGKAFMTTDQNIAQSWGLTGAPAMNQALVNDLLSVNMMTRFAKSKLANDTREFAVDAGTLYHLSPSQAANLGLDGSQPLMAVDPEAITPTITDWSSVIVKDATGKQYVIDGGTKRPFPGSTVQNFWTNNGSIPAQQMTNGFLDLLPTANYIERAIKGSGPNIYAAQNTTRRLIESWTTYQNSYAPYAQVNDALINVLPSGNPIP